MRIVPAVGIGSIRLLHRAENFFPLSGWGVPQPSMAEVRLASRGWRQPAAAGWNVALVGRGHQLEMGSVAALRDAKELSTPVLARPRVAIQDKAPAMTAPEMAQNTMYANLSPAA
jgi:hypothetical protein